jgi:hypothetical protein
MQQKYRSLKIGFYKSRTYRPQIRKADKNVFISVYDNTFNRYLYTLIKFFEIEGYQVFLPRDPKLMGELALDMYASFIYEEESVIFGDPPENHLTIKNLRADYYNPFFKNQQANSFIVPMAQHPAMYLKGLWDVKVNVGNRKRSVFMAGNFDKKIYDFPDLSRLFNVENRLVILDALRSKPYFLNIDRLDDLEEFLRGNEDRHVVIAQAVNARLPMEDLRPMLARFDFYLALPGMVMPVSHNIIEAMSTGAIPIMQESYSKLFRPPLEAGKHAILFRDQNHLDEVLKKSFALPDITVEIMRKNVLDYYKDYLTPSAVVSTIAKGNFDTLYVLAEKESVELLDRCIV